MRPLFCFVLLAVSAIGCGDDPAGPGGPRNTFGAAGGTFRSADGRLQIVVPPNALTSTTTFGASAATAAPPTTYLVGTAYDVSPATLTFGHSATLTISYDDASLSAGVNEHDLQLYEVVDGHWAVVAGSIVNPSANVLTAPITTLGTFAILSAAPVATIAIGSVSPTLEVHDTTQLTATLKDGRGAVLVGRGVIWQSSQPGVATVDPVTGVVTGVSVGSTSITARSEGKSTAVTITVTAPARVASVEIIPGTASIMIGGTLEYVVVVRDSAGRVLPGRIVTFTTGNRDVASISEAGLATALTAGSTTITATVEGVASAPASLTTLTGHARATRRWIGGAHGAPFDWSIAENWEESVVPTANDSVRIPAVAINRPVLSANTAVAAIAIEPGTTLNVSSFTLTVGHRADVLGEITGAGTVVIENGFLRGNFPSVRLGAATFVGESVIRGSLTVDRSVEMNGQPVTVQGDFNGVGLRMRRGGAGFVVQGNALLLGEERLTAGILIVHGNLTSGSIGRSAPAAVEASGTHRIFLAGSSTQYVVGQFDVQDFTIANFSGGVVFDNPAAGCTQCRTRVHLKGNLLFGQPSAVTGSGVLSVQGSITDRPGASINMSHVIVGSTMDTYGSFTADTTTFSGGSAQSPQAIPGSPRYSYKTVISTGPWVTFRDRTVIAGDLLIRAGMLDLDSDTVMVNGSLAADGVLRMRSAVGDIQIKGSARLTGSGIVATGEQTAGTLRVTGNVDATGTNWNPTGSHLTVLDGTGSAQSVTGVFQTLRVAGPAGISVEGTAVVKGNFDVQSAATVSGPGILRVAGVINAVSASAIRTRTVDVAGVLNALGTFAPETTVFSAASQIIPWGPNVTYGDVIVTGAELRLINSTWINRTLTVARGSILNMNNQTLTVGGAMRVAGVLRMRLVNDHLIVPSVSFAGSEPASGEQTDGKVTTQEFIGGPSWAPGGRHFVYIGKAGSIAYIRGSARFYNLRVDGPTSVSPSPAAPERPMVIVERNLEVWNGYLTGPGSVSVKQGTEIFSSGGVTVGTFEVGVGFLISTSANFSPDTAVYGRANQSIPTVATVFKSIRVTGTGVVAGETLRLSGQLTIASGATLSINASANVGQSLVNGGTLNIRTGTITDVGADLTNHAGATIVNGGTLRYGGVYTNNGTVTGNPPVRR